MTLLCQELELLHTTRYFYFLVSDSQNTRPPLIVRCLITEKEARSCQADYNEESHSTKKSRQPSLITRLSGEIGKLIKAERQVKAHQWAPPTTMHVVTASPRRWLQYKCGARWKGKVAPERVIVIRNILQILEKYHASKYSSQKSVKLKRED